MADIPISLLPSVLLVAWTAEFTFFIATCFTKVSVLLFYRRLLSPLCHHKVLFQIVWANIFFTVLYTTIFIMLSFTACRPFPSRWEHLAPGYSERYYCSDTSLAAPVSGALGAVSDLFAVVFPLTFLMALRMPLREKLTIYSVFTAGIL
jgi:hypothetical protein